jgi:hypothetical protein
LGTGTRSICTTNIFTQHNKGGIMIEIDNEETKTCEEEQEKA